MPKEAKKDTDGNGASARGGAPDLRGHDLRNFGKGGLDSVGMTATTMGPQKLRESGTVGHREGGDAGIVNRITQAPTPPQYAGRCCGLDLAKNRR